jgi:hypothetical protein
MKISTLIVIALALAALVYLGLKWHHAGRSNEDLSALAPPELSPARLA